MKGGLDITPILFTGFIFQACKDFDMMDGSPQPSSPVPIISSSPILYTIMSKINSAAHDGVVHDNRISANSQPIFSDWWCINDILGTQLL